MTLYPNCKINYGLRVVRKREDGYHDIETIFFPIRGLRDRLEISPIKDGEMSFEQTGIVIDCRTEDNLILRCYHNMVSLFPEIGPVAIRLEKNIPFGAGLGGGSSDAAHTAIALNELFHLHLTTEQLIDIVRPLGADCAFFIINQPCFATGIGDVLRRIDFSLRGKRILLLKPDVFVSTRDAYASIRPSEKPFNELENDFETTVFARHPILGEIKERLLLSGASHAAMSGSGSTIFGLFEKDSEGGSLPYDRLLDKDLTSMVILDDTL